MRWRSLRPGGTKISTPTALVVVEPERIDEPPAYAGAIECPSSRRRGETDAGNDAMLRTGEIRHAGRAVVYHRRRSGGQIEFAQYGKTGVAAGEDAHVCTPEPAGYFRMVARIGERAAGESPTPKPPPPPLDHAHAAL